MTVMGRQTAEPSTARRTRERAVPDACRFLSTRLILATGAMLAGGGVISLGYRVAVTELGSGRIIIWLGLMLVSLAFLGAVAFGDLTSAQAVTLCCLLGGVLYLMKLGREPHAFIYTDELQHVRSTAALLAGARLFVANPINPVLAHYPGLHVATAAIARLTGLSAFAAGNLLIAAARILLMASLFALFNRLLRSSKLAAIGVLVYAANPAYMYFDAQFSYESLALPLAVTALALVIREPGDRMSPAVTNVLIALLIAATIFTHHITGIVLGPLMLLFGAASWGRSADRRQQAIRGLGWGTAASVGMAAWIVFVAPDTWHYLAPDIKSTLQTIPNFLSGKVQARTPFAKSPLPTPRYEEAAGLLSVVLDFVFLLFGAFVGRRRQMRTGHLVLCLFLGLVYFASLPLQLLQGATAAPIAPRIWETSFIGLAPLAAVGVTWLIERNGRLMFAAVAVSTFVMLMGGATIRSGPNIRLPGPYLPSGGPLAATPDTLRAARWFLKNYGPDRRIMADETLASVFGAYALATPETYQNFGIKPWRVFLTPTLTPAGAYELARSGTQFVVVDRRITRYRAFGGYYFSPQEPREPYATVPPHDIDKFATSPGFTEIYDSGNIVIYRYEAPFPAPTVK
jgi:hypothetical protein